MKGKVKVIKRSEWYVGSQADLHSHENHNTRITSLYAETYNGHKVLINESDVLSYYGRQRFSDNLLSDLNVALQNKLISYESNEDGDYILTGSISIYLN